MALALLIAAYSIAGGKPLIPPFLEIVSLVPHFRRRNLKIDTEANPRSLSSLQRVKVSSSSCMEKPSSSSSPKHKYGPFSLSLENEKKLRKF